jgi:hypothetical protein
MRAVWLTLSIATALGSTPRIADACKCAGPKPSVPDAFNGAALIVEGKVLSHEFVGDSGWHTRVAVTRTHKGPIASRVEIIASRTCAYGFHEGERYLVYAYDTGDGGFSTTYCTRTAKLADARDDLALIADPPPSTTEEPAVMNVVLLAGWTTNPVIHWMRVVAMMLAATRATR